MRHHLLTPHCQLSLRAGEDGKVMLSYFGSRLAEPDDAFVCPVAEYPLMPTDYDARGYAVNRSGEYALHLVLPDGSRSVDLRLEEADLREDRAVLRLRDAVLCGLWLTVELRVDPAEDVVAWSAVLHNGTEGEVQVLRVFSAAWTERAERYFVTSFRGAWAGESLLQEEELMRGNALCLGADTGIKNAQEGTPGFVLALGTCAQEEQGECIQAALCWSGAYAICVKHSACGHAFVGLGHDFAASPYTLLPGCSLELPAVLLSRSVAGKGPACRSLHRYLGRHVLPQHEMPPQRCVLNSWEGVHFDVREESLRAMIRGAAGLGVELFVLDDGWFGQRHDDTSSLGDWQPNPEKLPGGLSALARYAAEQGLGFGLWVEPEMLCPQSELFRRHPDWALQVPGRRLREERHQLVLDLTNPAVQQFVSETVAQLLEEHPVCYVKWDCNRKITELYSPHLPARLQGNLLFDYVAAYYRIMRELRRRFPGVVFQCCSAGGGRMDLGAAAYHEEFWCSDNTDAFERLRMQWALCHFFPPQTMASHVTVSPNLYTGRCTSLKFRCDVAAPFRFGVELDPRSLSAAEADELRERLAAAKELRPLLAESELYRLVSPYEGPDCALFFVHRSARRACLFAYTGERLFTDQHTRIRLRGLPSAARYTLRELGEDSGGFRCPLHSRTLGADYLMTTGLPLHWNRPMQSCVILLERVDENI